MKREDDSWIEGDDNIDEEAINFFQKQFTKESHQMDLPILSCIFRIVDDTENIRLISPPNMEELKDIVFSMSSYSAPGPDGISKKFYHTCWEIIKDDLLLMVLDYFAGTELPRSFTHTCLIMIPKVDCPQKFTEFRPISFSNFSCKIISKLMNYKLTPLIQKLVSPCQAGFIKDRSIANNIMLTQELVHNINQDPQTGFSEPWIEVWRLISNVSYSINLNGSRQGFFKSTRGIKQGGPLPLSLFVIGAELLSRLMNNLYGNGFILYSAERRGPLITHMCYADDTIFSSADPTSLKRMMTNLELYERISGQKINKNKSGFYVSSNLSNTQISDI
nr:uncharacterized protein LOC104102667 [Nicotiana tomentosiformis]